VVEWQVDLSPFNHLMQLLAQESFIKFSPHEAIHYIAAETNFTAGTLIWLGKV